jgi:ATP-dependent Clp protease ATP-binding subunit ClpB
VDEILIFKALSKQTILKIVKLQIEELQDKIKERKIAIEVSTEAQKLLAEKGYDPAYGARPLKRIVQKYIQNPLALEILEGRYQEGDVIRVDVDQEGAFVFRKK